MLRNLDNHIDNINDIIKNKKWDRVYVSTLFTFEYEETIKAIDYAKSLVGKDKCIYRRYSRNINAKRIKKRYRSNSKYRSID